jgi:hypothetical protein
MDCDGCIWHVRAHYDGTPDDEIYDECERNWVVLHEDDQRCSYYTPDDDQEDY